MKPIMKIFMIKMKKLFYLFLALIMLACSDDEGNLCNYNPTLTTTTASLVTDNSATLNGTIQIDSPNCDSPNNIEQGFVYATSIQPTLNDNVVNVNGVDLNSSITNLEPETTYYYRTFLTNALGEFYGNEVSFTTGIQGLNIGDLANGGIVFWIDPTDYTKGLVSALQDQGNKQWGCNGTYIINATDTAIGSGLSNTNAIVNYCNETDIAAKICYDLNLNGYDDWYLPSKDELNLMYNNLHLNGLGNFTTGTPGSINGWYWSSTDGEDNGDAAWVQSFKDGHNGSQATYDIGIKDFYNNVRAIRSF